MGQLNHLSFLPKTSTFSPKKLPLHLFPAEAVNCEAAAADLAAAPIYLAPQYQTITPTAPLRHPQNHLHLQHDASLTA